MADDVPSIGQHEPSTAEIGISDQIRDQTRPSIYISFIKSPVADEALLDDLSLSIQPDTDAIEIWIIHVPQVQSRDMEFHIVDRVAFWEILNTRYCHDGTTTSSRGN